VGDVPKPVGRRDGGEKHPQKLAEGHAHRGDGPGLDHQEQRPPEQKSPQRPQRLAQVDILSAGLGHHRRQLTVTERPNQRKDGRYHPRPQK
jgi:hypothetical protein